jgi:peptide/nickel transport system permease protein
LNYDWTLVMGILVISTVLVVVSNMLADVLYAVADPRIRYS